LLTLTYAQLGKPLDAQDSFKQQTSTSEEIRFIQDVRPEVPCRKRFDEPCTMGRFQRSRKSNKRTNQLDHGEPYRKTATYSA
jgi:hypothetical protein